MLERVCSELGVPYVYMAGFLARYPHASLAQQAVCFIVRARKHGFIVNLRLILHIFDISYLTYLKTRHSLHAWIKTDPPLCKAEFRQSLLRIFLHTKTIIAVDPWINRLCADALHSINYIESSVWQIFLSIYGPLWTTYQSHKSPFASRVHVLRLLMMSFNIPISILSPYFHPLPSLNLSNIP
ncbi:hypothetical protein NEF87_004894 [Candidatus Lokiarchaeum ossiferum]|uniref:Uncharacterized protein n=1 Tax=Candidatus Lokiarchaeum ossiferum TaxID=2951803 RepID=A0ABY6HYJ9_9ARCH|nr:hypothetical protein NEF87_004894 [Candidatus Lokiarchaeum sp. B-35]